MSLYSCNQDYTIYKKDQVYQIDIISVWGSNIFAQYNVYQDNKHLGIINSRILFRYFTLIP